MKENLRKANSRKKYAIAVLLCVLVLFVVVLILSKKNSKEGDVMAIYVQEEGADLSFFRYSIYSYNSLCNLII